MNCLVFVYFSMTFPGRNVFKSTLMSFCSSFEILLILEAVWFVVKMLDSVNLLFMLFAIFSSFSLLVSIGGGSVLFRSNKKIIMIIINNSGMPTPRHTTSKSLVVVNSSSDCNKSMFVWLFAEWGVFPVVWSTVSVVVGSTGEPETPLR